MLEMLVFLLHLFYLVFGRVFTCVCTSVGNLCGFYCTVLNLAVLVLGDFFFSLEGEGESCGSYVWFRL